MRLDIHAVILFAAPRPVEAVLMVEAAWSEDHTILSEQLSAPEGLAETHPCTGARLLGFTAEGSVRIEYRASIENGERQTFDDDIEKTPLADLPQVCLDYLEPTQLCPSDRFEPFAEGMFGHIVTAGQQARAVLDWVEGYLSNRPGFSNQWTTAEDTFHLRSGVCRDFAHVAICLFRALGTPARYVSAYAWRLQPPDFHAVVEIYLGDRWWLVDPTGRAPVEGLVRIGSGRDAADVAFLTTSGRVHFKGLKIAVTEVEEQPALASVGLEHERA